jgi:hypothetical protein
MNRDLLRRVTILGIVLAPMAVLLPACNKHDNKQPADTTAPSSTAPADNTMAPAAPPADGSAPAAPGSTAP